LHLIMTDNNSDAIAELVIDWCDRKRLRADNHFNGRNA